jgi:hypothetical protein
MYLTIEAVRKKGGYKISAILVSFAFPLCRGWLCILWRVPTPVDLHMICDLTNLIVVSRLRNQQTFLNRTAVLMLLLFGDAELLQLPMCSY